MSIRTSDDPRARAKAIPPNNLRLGDLLHSAPVLPSREAWPAAGHSAWLRDSSLATVRNRPCWATAFRSSGLARSSGRLLRPQCLDLFGPHGPILDAPVPPHRDQ